jgi:CheY-like chemotaxis protein
MERASHRVMNKGRIMIVDDDPKLSRLMGVILERAGEYTLCEENRPSAAFKTAKAFQPDIILMDVDMPGKNGGEVASEIERDPGMSKTPIVFVTSLVSKKEAGLYNGKRFMSKPVDPVLLLKTVREILVPASV